jgi:hypothetical protein
MHLTKPIFIAALFLGLANPAIAQTDPHHPEGADTTATEAETPAEGVTPLPTPQAGSVMSQCPDMLGMMGMMQPGTDDPPQMQMMEMMRSMQMMQMDMMQMMQQMQKNLAAPGAPAEGGTP